MACNNRNSSIAFGDVDLDSTIKKFPPVSHVNNLNVSDPISIKKILKGSRNYEVKLEDGHFWATPHA